MTETRWPKIAVMGAGAVGSYFGGMLARAGAPVTLVGRAAHVEAIRHGGLFIDSIHFQERVPVETSADAAGVCGAELILFCVKGPDTEEAARAVVPHLAKNAVTLSMQNGVDNAARIRQAAGVEAISAVVYVAASLPEPGRIKHVGRGELVVGDVKNIAFSPDNAVRRELIESIPDLFLRAGVPCRVAEDIRVELWTKMVMNCAWNAVSALTRSTYGRAGKDPLVLELILASAREAIAVGCAEGVPLNEAKLIEQGIRTGEVLALAISSTAQDILRGKRTEIDSLNGYIVKHGAALGIAVPTNQTLYALVKLLEKTSAKAVSAAPAG
jgi:2-dehydropantoate 2-reductase